MIGEVRAFHHRDPRSAEMSTATTYIMLGEQHRIGHADIAEAEKQRSSFYTPGRAGSSSSRLLMLRHWLGAMHERVGNRKCCSDEAAGDQAGGVPFRSRPPGV